MTITPISVGRSLVYQTSSGPYTVTPNSFGYAQLRSSPVVTEARLLELVTPPPLPEGIFIAYTRLDSLVVYHIPDDGPENFYTVVNGAFVTARFATTRLGEQCGLFPSLASVIDAFPEYFI